MNKTFKNILSTLMLVVSAMAFAACNTMDGVGKDVERAGEEIQDGAR